MLADSHYCSLSLHPSMKQDALLVRSTCQGSKGEILANNQRGTEALSPTAHEEIDPVDNHVSSGWVLPQLRFDLRLQHLLIL